MRKFLLSGLVVVLAGVWCPVKLKVFQAPLSYVISAHTPLVLINTCGQSRDWGSKVCSGEQAMYDGSAASVGVGLDQLVAHLTAYPAPRWSTP